MERQLSPSFNCKRDQDLKRDAERFIAEVHRGLDELFEMLKGGEDAGI